MSDVLLEFIVAVVYGVAAFIAGFIAGRLSVRVANGNPTKEGGTVVAPKQSSRKGSAARRFFNWDRSLTLAFVILALLTVLQGIALQRQVQEQARREISRAQCQVEYNTRVAQVYTARQMIADQDRAAQDADRRALIAAVATITQATNRQQTQEALRRLLEAQRRTDAARQVADAERAKNPIPDINEVRVCNDNKEDK